MTLAINQKVKLFKHSDTHEHVLATLNASNVSEIDGQATAMLESGKNDKEETVTVEQAERIERTIHSIRMQLDSLPDQVARQLELGYDRIAPHNAVFEGFADA